MEGVPRFKPQSKWIYSRVPVEMIRQDWCGVAVVKEVDVESDDEGEAWRQALETEIRLLDDDSDSLATSCFGAVCCLFLCFTASPR